jgi:G3E family GTPase
MFNVPKIPVILVTGFLGSGKTTFLRRLAETHPDWYMVFLVNEFAEFSVDGDTLAATGTATHSVVGGSLFCECKAGDFLRIMREEVLTMHRRRALDAVVIETSGTADPDAIGQLMLDHGLGQDFEVRRIISIVAPKRFLKMLENLPVIESQIQSSDLIVINKTDTADDATIEEAESAIRIRNPNTTIIRTEQCRFTFHLSKVLTELPNAPLSTCDANPFSTKSVQFKKDLPHLNFLKWLDALPSAILRVKGHVQTNQGGFHLEYTVDSRELTPCKNQPQSEFILISHDDDEPILKQTVKQLKELAS